MSQSVEEELFDTHSSSTNGNSNDSRNNNVKLPKISLPSFDGTLKNWQTFRDMYATLIHNNSGISNVEKFQYLVSSLSGPPISLVTALPINNANYQVAYDALTKRYQNKRALAGEHWRTIQSAPTVNAESPEQLQKTLDVFVKNLALDLLGFKTKRWDFVLFNLLLDKIDTETKRAFEREFTKTEVPTFEELKLFISEYSEALMRVKKTTSSRVANNLSNNSNKYGGKINSSKVLAMTTTVELSCPLCKEPHYLNQCSKFIQLSPKVTSHCVSFSSGCVRKFTNCSVFTRFRVAIKSHYANIFKTA